MQGELVWKQHNNPPYSSDDRYGRQTGTSTEDGRGDATRQGSKPRKRLTFQVSEEHHRPYPQDDEQLGPSQRSQSTPNLADKDRQGAVPTRKLQSGLKKLAGRWGIGSYHENHIESAYSDTNISAIPHYDLEFPAGTSDQLISTIHENTLHDHYSRQLQSAEPVNHVRHIYQGWKDFRRGVKYQVPSEFSLFWVVLGISPNKRFKMKLYFDPDRRQVYINWDTQLGNITYFDGVRTNKVECMTTVERHDIWSMTVSKDKTLQISCNFEPVAYWKLVSDQNMLCVQPMRFGGKYYLTVKDGLPPRHENNSNMQEGISMVELDRSNSTTTGSSVGSSEEYQIIEADFQETEFGVYDEATIKWNKLSLMDMTEHYHSSLLTNSYDDGPSHSATQQSPEHQNHHPQNNHPQNNQPQNNHPHQHLHQNNSYPPYHYNRSRNNSSDNTRDIIKVKQLTNNLVTLISQLEADSRDNENSFKQKIRTLDMLSRNLVQTLKTIQRESRDSKAEMKRREADQLNYTIALEDRIARLEDILSGSEHNSLADGFADVIQQYIETDGFNAPSRPKRILPNIKEQIQELSYDMNEKLKSLNKRIKLDQSAMVKEMNYIKKTVDMFREKTQMVLLELETGINSCAQENQHLSSRHSETVSDNDDNFTRVQDQINTFDMRLTTLDAALEELEQSQMLVEEEREEADLGGAQHYDTMEDLSTMTHFGSEDSRRGSTQLPSIQEENRMEDVEKTCRELMEQIKQQNREIASLRDENVVFRNQFRRDLGLGSPVQEDTVPTENMKGTYHTTEETNANDSEE